ncbi:lysozyme inhibitor LprI family protein [Pandoraea bronchicola]|uniref:Lipoprotein LprI n=1 Tax=Pandoraea bronchicola TaxID=2508287 RepID=A0A5E5BSH1_9BURK|nr:lysozyme inhibitor LprI family protein [Pandoraea bronchicola]VVE88368.1 Lipoprotein LprI [Pandoraea bronchicola]
MREIALIAIAAATLLNSHFAHAQVASFDCGKARTAVEKRVCRNPSLGALDIRMATYYQILSDARPASEGMAYREFRDGLRAEQNRWQRQVRDACGEKTACLRDAYQERIDALRSLTRQVLTLVPGASAVTNEVWLDPRNTTFIIEGENIALSNGKSEHPVAAGSAAVRVSQLVGPMTSGMVNGTRGTAVFLSDDPGGSGTFYYVAVALPEGRGTNAIFLGDRIKPQSIEISQGKVTVSYLDRPQQATMAEKPSIEKVRHFTLIDGHLAESK